MSEKKKPVRMWCAVNDDGNPVAASFSYYRDSEGLQLLRTDGWKIVQVEIRRVPAKKKGRKKK